MHTNDKTKPFITNTRRITAKLVTSCPSPIAVPNSAS